MAASSQNVRGGWWLDEAWLPLPLWWYQISFSSYLNLPMQLTHLFREAGTDPSKPVLSPTRSVAMVQEKTSQRLPAFSCMQLLNFTGVPAFTCSP